MIKLTTQQQEAFNQIVEFLKKPHGVFILKGYAGTGKTTLLSFVVDYLKKSNKDFRLMAPTGRAAKILKEKTESNAVTIHKHIYKYNGLEEKRKSDENVEGVEFFFPLNQNPGCQLCIVDEASMIGTIPQEHEFLHFGTGSLLEDLLSFTHPGDSGKIIFIGDSAQLPPVGDPMSNALDEEFFRKRGIDCDSYELTEIIRQGQDSVILKNSVAIRNALNNPMCRTIQFKTKENEFEEVHSLVETIQADAQNIIDARAIVITYSNKLAKAYNDAVRDVLFPGKQTICVGDRVIIVKNRAIDELTMVYNGEFAKVSFVSDEVETLSAPVYVQKNGKSEKIIQELKFRDISLLHENGTVISTKIIETLLDSDSPSLTREENTALYVNFLLRHSDIRKDRERFNEALMTDPYFNALHIKYGYAITCHKAQGGEWDTVYSDIENRKLLNNDSLRWIYTAITRAKNRFAAASLPFLEKTSSLKISAISSMSKMNSDLLSNVIAPELTAYHSKETLPGVKAKLFAVIDTLEGSGYAVEKVETRQYLEMYHISHNGETKRYDGRYDKSGWVSFKNVSDPVLAKLLNDNSRLNFSFEYEPSTVSFRQLYEKVCEGADLNGVTITGIQEQRENYKIIYNMIGQESVMKVEFFFDSKGSVTTAAPSSTKGEDDLQLKELLKHIS